MYTKPSIWKAPEPTTVSSAILSHWATVLGPVAATGAAAAGPRLSINAIAAPVASPRLAYRPRRIIPGVIIAEPSLSDGCAPPTTQERSTWPNGSVFVRRGV